MKHTTSILTALCASALASQAAITVNLPGATTTDGWDELIGSRITGFGGYPGLTPWPGTVPSNVAGSTNAAEFGKTAGGGYFGGSSFYDGGNVGSLTINSLSVLPGLETVVFQIDMGATSFTTPPSLLLNGTTLLAPDVNFVTEGDYSFSFGGPAAPTENHVFQWDLSDDGPVSSYTIQWDTAIHTTIFEMQLDTGDQFAAVVPEPSAIFLTFVPALALLGRRKRQA